MSGEARAGLSRSWIGGRQLEQLAETQHRNQKLAESRTKTSEDTE